MDPATLVRMANQIAAFFSAQSHDEAVAGISAHIRSFWEPRMRQGLYAVMDGGGEGLEGLVVEAAADLRKSEARP